MCASVTEHRGWHSRGCAQVSVSGVIACALGPCVYMYTCEHARARTSAECLFTPGVSECAHWDDRHGLVSVCACAHVDVAVGCPVEACGCPRRLQHRQRGARGAERRVQLCMTRSARPRGSGLPRRSRGSLGGHSRSSCASGAHSFPFPLCCVLVASLTLSSSHSCSPRLLICCSAHFVNIVFQLPRLLFM